MDFNEKRKQVEAIRDEVGELHKILENIFPKLPNVTSYEYTHGQHERGADFVLEIESLTTKRRSFTGVVVKCGKVTGPLAQDIEEQIRECAEERAYKVMKRIRCNDVWVFSSGGYTERSKEKLQERLPGRSIEFFGPEDIARFVDDHYPYFWHKLPIEVGAYLQQLSEKIMYLDRAASLLVSATDQSMYIDLDTYERIRNTYSDKNKSKSKQMVKEVDFIKEAISSKCSILEADVGFGKSKLARRLAQQLCSADSYLKSKKVPIFSTYVNFLNLHNGSVEHLVEAVLGEALPAIKSDGADIVLILDGIDECGGSGRSTSDLFESLYRQVKDAPNISTVITSRPLKSLVDRASAYAESRIFGIRPLSIFKIVRYLEETCSRANLPVRLFEDLKRSPLFKQLPHSPIAAALFSNLLNENKQEVPQSLTELYTKSIELMLGRWEQKKDLATEKQYKTAHLIAEQLAVYFVENKLIYIAKSEASDFVSQYLSKRNIGVSQAEIEEILFYRSNVFVEDSDLQVVSFRHRSFSEFLCAHKKSKDRSLSVIECSLDPYWTNVFYFYSGLLLDCAEVLRELRSTPAANEVQEWLKILSVPSYLLAAYQTEFEVVEENLFDVFINSARLYLRVRSGDTKMQLCKLSEMQLLYLFKSIVVESCGYPFFSRSFDSLLLKISDGVTDPEVRYHAMFFLACSAAECDASDAFDYLVDSVGAERLPLSLSFAIRCEIEGKSNFHKNRLIKLHQEKLQKVLVPSQKRQSGNLVVLARNKIEDLFERPLSARSDLKQKVGK
jgi:hypothetical protein